MKILLSEQILIIVDLFDSFFNVNRCCPLVFLLMLDLRLMNLNMKLHIHHIILTEELNKVCLTSVRTTRTNIKPSKYNESNYTEKFTSKPVVTS